MFSLFSFALYQVLYLPHQQKYLIVENVAAELQNFFRFGESLRICFLLNLFSNCRKCFRSALSNNLYCFGLMCQVDVICTSA